MTNPHAEDVDVRHRAEPVREEGPKHRGPTARRMPDRRLYAWMVFTVVMTALFLGALLEAVRPS